MMRVTSRVEGQQETMRRFERLRKTGVRRVLRKSVRAGAAPQVKHAKRNAARRTGLLKKATAQKIKSYRGGQYVLAVVGARDIKGVDDRGRPARPAWYSHLVDGGAKAHTIRAKKKKSLAFEVASSGGRKKAKKTIYRGQVEHPGVKGTRYLQSAFRSSRGEALTRFKSKFVSETWIEAKRS